MMTNETKTPVLLTEAEWQRISAPLGLTSTIDQIANELRERGLIAPEPEKTPSDHAWQVCVDHGYRYPHSREHNLATAALRRGMELAKPELTREVVRRAAWDACQIDGHFDEAYVDRLHAALTEGQSK